MGDADWRVVRAVLLSRGVAGARYFGQPVVNGGSLRAGLDERAAMPVLIELLPVLTDRSVVVAVAGHLDRPWARPSAFSALRIAFELWAPADVFTGSAVGAALAVSAAAVHAVQVVELAVHREFGTARQPLVTNLGRFPKVREAGTAAWELAADDDVALQALSALRRLAGAQVTLDRARQIITERPGTPAALAASHHTKNLHRAHS